MATLRKELPPTPANMGLNPLDDRGYPVPFFVQWMAGKPEFRAMDPQKLRACVLQKLCWVCGRPLGNLPPVFVIGPMCAVNRVSSEPPSHAVCARYSVVACPFLSRPQMTRRENDLPEGMVDAAGIGIKRNPGVTLLWFASFWQPRQYPDGLLFHFTAAPKMVEWWTQGRLADRDEVLASIDSGLPLLREYAEKDGPAAVHALEGYYRRAMKLLPPEKVA